MTDEKPKKKPNPKAIKPDTVPIAKVKIKDGRPTKYKPEYCDDIVEYMGKGHSLTSWCADHDVIKETAYNWMREHPDFLIAFKKAQALAQKHWENMLHLTAAGKLKGNLGAQIFWMKNRFRDEWKDRQDLEFSAAPQDPALDAESDILKVIPSEDLTMLIDKVKK